MYSYKASSLLLIYVHRIFVMHCFPLLAWTQLQIQEKSKIACIISSYKIQVVEGADRYDCVGSAAVRVKVASMTWPCKFSLKLKWIFRGSFPWFYPSLGIFGKVTTLVLTRDRAWESFLLRFLRVIGVNAAAGESSGELYPPTVDSSSPNYLIAKM